MFNKRELSLLKDGYFTVIRENEQFVEVMSKNTKHCWMIFKKRSDRGRPIRLYHKHTYKTQWYHLHWETYTVASAVKSIKGHDDYVMKNGETIRWMRGKGAAKYGAI